MMKLYALLFAINEERWVTTFRAVHMENGAILPSLYLTLCVVWEWTVRAANSGISTTYATSIACGSHTAKGPMFQKLKSAAAYRMLVCRLTAPAGRTL